MVMIREIISSNYNFSDTFINPYISLTEKIVCRMIDYPIIDIQSSVYSYQPGETMLSSGSILFNTDYEGITESLFIEA
jgi:hypothetical protein